MVNVQLSYTPCNADIANYLLLLGFNMYMYQLK